MTCPISGKPAEWGRVVDGSTIRTQTPTDNLTEYEAELGAVLELDPQAQDLLFREARTANTFTDEPVTDEQMRAVYDLVKWAPTSMNNQPLRGSSYLRWGS